MLIIDVLRLVVVCMVFVMVLMLLIFVLDGLLIGVNLLLDW